MRVMVTGATGFIGAYAVEAMLRAGHETRLLVRSKQKVERVLGARGIQATELVYGDMTDAGAVRKALEGCDAVLHAAAAVGVERRPEIFETNGLGNRNVLGAAVEMGLDPIVYTSSVGALFPPRGPVITVEDPVGTLETAYGRSKADGERYARELQAGGAPLVSIYPAGVYGPQDPGPGDGTKGLRDRLRYGWPRCRGGTSCVDVRDLAEILAATLEPGRGPRRYMAAGHFVTWTEEADLCEEITGRKVLRIPASPRFLHAVGHVVDFIKRVHPRFDYPLTHEASLFVTEFVPCDSSATLRELGVGFRPLRETHSDAIRWMAQAGELPAKYAGTLAS
jgi:nucleoside-diphosphate-sugar epimerase